MASPFLRMGKQHLLQVQILLHAPEHFVADVICVAQTDHFGALRGDHFKSQPPVGLVVLAILIAVRYVLISRQAMGAMCVRLQEIFDKVCRSPVMVGELVESRESSARGLQTRARLFLLLPAVWVEAEAPDDEREREPLQKKRGEDHGKVPE